MSELIGCGDDMRAGPCGADVIDKTQYKKERDTTTNIFQKSGLRLSPFIQVIAGHKNFTTGETLPVVQSFFLAKRSLAPIIKSLKPAVF